MRLHWKALIKSLLRSINSPESVKQFEEIKKKSKELTGFETPGDFISFLNDNPSNGNRKEIILRAIIKMAKHKEYPVARDLFLICIARELEKIIVRQVRAFSRPEWEVVSQVVDIFLREIHRFNSDTLNITNFVLNIHHGIWEERKRCHPLENHEQLHEDETGMYGAFTPRDSWILGIHLGTSWSDEARAIHTWLKKNAGKDADLIFRSIISVEDQCTLAEELGISHAALRVRLHRAYRRLAEKIKKTNGDVDCL